MEPAITITLPSNLNNKLGCAFLVHIMQPKNNAITSKSFEAGIAITDGTTKVLYKLWDYVDEEAKKIPAHLVMLSHGQISRDQFLQEMYERHKIMPEQKAGVYFFSKVS
jgi:hypothetical protein